MGTLAESSLKLGIIAGGQLGKMLIQEASKWDIATVVLDDDEQCPSRSLATRYVQGSRLDREAVYSFGKQVDVLTLEIESVNIEALKQLKAEGCTIAPDPDVVELIQDKGKQKQFYKEQGIPSSAFELMESESEIKSGLADGRIRFPFVQKLRKGGYDGRGVAVIEDESHLSELLPGPSVIEHRVDIAKEISVIVARNRRGDIQCYPVVEMVFDPKANLVDKLICPASITPEQSKIAVDCAVRITEMLRLEGVLAVELFVDRAGEVVVNEIAPRPHNSGHHTIESVMTSQFEQHLRAILNLPLGSSDLKMPAVMLNLLGAEGYAGPVRYRGLAECMALDNVKIHLYGKKVTRPFRKMGHVTVLAASVKEALAKAEKVQQLLKVES